MRTRSNACALVAAVALLTVGMIIPAKGSTVTFTNHVAPGAFAGLRAGETSIGVNVNTNSAFFQELGRTIRIRWDAAGNASWEQVFSQSTNDPILWADRTTGRIFVANLIAYAGSQVQYSDDDGVTWQTSEPGIVLPSWDHESLGGGPYPSPITNSVYPNQIYYCAQPGVDASQCARSDDGGVTWGAPFVSNPRKCAGLHGHIAVAPDGTIMIPDKRCGASQGVLVSSTLGHVFLPAYVSGTAPGHTDPKVAFDTGNRMYFIGASPTDPTDPIDSKALVATSDDKGATWTEPIDVGATFGVQNVEFPMVVAGDQGRAAVAFYGTPAIGDDQSATFEGEWHLYIALTYDGGATWETIDATPADPVQRGCIWMTGGSNPCRNLLDFQDMTMDAHGRVLVGYADGCTSTACMDPSGTPANSRASRGVIARQSGGRGLLAAYDSGF